MKRRGGEEERRRGGEEERRRGGEEERRRGGEEEGGRGGGRERRGRRWRGAYFDPTQSTSHDPLMGLISQMGNVC